MDRFTLVSDDLDIEYETKIKNAIDTFSMLDKGDTVLVGFSGGKDSGAKRLALLKKLNLPEHMSANAMLQALNLLYTLEELTDLLQENN